MNFFHQFTAIVPKRDKSKPFEVNLNTYRWSKRSLTICKLPFWLNNSNSCIRNHIRVCHIHETRWPRDFNSDISTFSSQSKMCCKRALTQIVCTGTDFLRLQDGANVNLNELHSQNWSLICFTCLKLFKHNLLSVLPYTLLVNHVKKKA